MAVLRPAEALRACQVLNAPRLCRTPRLVLSITDGYRRVRRAYADS